eukprot:7043009-Prymnesium_polylepis.1
MAPVPPVTMWVQVLFCASWSAFGSAMRYRASRGTNMPAVANAVSPSASRGGRCFLPHGPAQVEATRVLRLDRAGIDLLRALRDDPNAHFGNEAGLKQ